MTLEALIVAGGILAAFLTFGIALAYGDISTADLRRDGTARE